MVPAPPRRLKNPGLRGTDSRDWLARLYRALVANAVSAMDVTRCRTASHHRLGRNQQQKPSELARSAEFRHRAENLRVIFDVGRERMKAVRRGLHTNSASGPH